MAEKPKEGSGQVKKRPVVKRPRRGGTAGRIAIRRDTAPYRSAAMDEHSVQVREQIDAALAEARRVREDIEQRIERRLHDEESGPAVKLLEKLTAHASLRAGKPPDVEAQARGKGQDLTSRPKLSK
jgi:hypothetical protein